LFASLFFLRDERKLKAEIAIRLMTLMKKPKMYKLLKSQWLHETGKGTSRVFIEDKNLFGMKMPKKRPTVALGPDKNGYAIYRSYADSVRDLFLWFEYNGINLDQISGPAVYAKILKDKGYYEDSVVNYSAGLARYYYA
jgi:flagellum-specific peptidoglycan hydrolase FlgJ